MADIRTSSLGGVPKGETADRPANPSIGDIFYNGTLGCLEIYTSAGWVANSAPPAIPSTGTPTQLNSASTYAATSSVSVPITSGSGGGLPNYFTVTSSPGSITTTGTSSPITVTGLTTGTAYTFTTTATNNFNTSGSSISSNSITATTVPQAPTIGTASVASGTSMSLSFTAGATGGSSITNYKYSTDGTTYTAFSPAQTTSPVTISGLTNGNSYTFYLKAVNSNGDSTASSASNTVELVKATGGTVTTDGSYTVHKFNSSSSFTPLINLTVEYLVVAGGGGGGDGGGGAGGLLHHTAKSLTPQEYVITVGAGGPAGPYPSTNGVNTTAFGVTANGGGRGGNQTGYSGGSGSGGGRYGTTTGASATQTSQDGATGYGNAGGNGEQNTFDAGGGGGGAGGVGGNGGSNGFGGVGGNGRTYSISGSSVVYATGGGGHSQAPSHTGSLGGSSNVNGGKGNSPSGSVAATSATSNTGSGGGGGASSSGGAGGSGVVIVRYLS